jgi:hypothetical protein
MRSVDVALYRLTLNFDSGGNAKIVEGCADADWSTKGESVCSKKSLMMADGTAVDLAKAKLCGRTYCSCIKNFVHDFCVQTAGLTIQDSVEDDPRSFLAFSTSWGTSFVKSTRIGATLEVNMLIQEKRNTSDLYSFEKAKAAMESEFRAGFSTTSDKDSAPPNNNIHISLVSNGGDPRVGVATIDWKKNAFFGVSTIDCN